MKRIRVEIRISKIEKDKLKSLAKERDMTMTQYILECCLKEHSNFVKSKIATDVYKMQMRNFKVETNMNQIAKRVNSNKNLSKTDFDHFQKASQEFRNLISEQNEMVKKLFKKLRK